MGKGLKFQISQFQPVQQKNLDRHYIRVIVCLVWFRLQCWTDSDITLAFEEAQVTRPDQTRPDQTRPKAEMSPKQICHKNWNVTKN